MKSFVINKAIVRPGRYFKAKNKKEAFEKIQKYMVEFVQKADVDDLVIDVTDDLKDFMEEG